MQVVQEGRQVTDLIYISKRIMILCAEKALLDGLSAGLALYHLFDSMDKKSSVFYSGDIPTEVVDLPGIHRVKKNSDPKSLKMSIDYAGEGIEKVNYSMSEGRLNLVFYPAPKGFSPSKIDYSIEGKKYDLVFVLGAKELRGVGRIYHEIEDDIKPLNIINIDNSRDNTNFGSINIVDHNADSISEILFFKLAAWRFKPTQESAKSLLYGLSFKSLGKKSDLPITSLDSAA